MIATIELNDLVAFGEPAREPDARRGRFRSAVHHPHFLDRRHPIADEFRHLHFERIWSSKTQAARGRVPHRIDNYFRRVTENRRSSTADIVDVFISIDIVDARAFRALNEERLAADIAKGGPRGGGAPAEFFLLGVG